jgi:5'-nucleotidase
MPTMRARRTARLSCAVLALAALGTPTAAAAKPRHHQARFVDLQVLAVNDFHGNMEASPGLTTAVGPPRAGSTSPVSVLSGGVQYLATHLRRARRGHRHTITVSSGDLIGGSPLLSGLFHDEPTIEAFNRMGLAFNALGNHEFDEGKDELLRMQKGGCHPVDGCQDKTPFRGARFRFLSANAVVAKTGRTLFPPYAIRRFGGVKVAFVGLTLEGAPDVVSPAGVAGLKFRDEADAMRSLMPRLRRRHVKAIVVLLHQGGFQTAAKAWDYDTCKGLDGEILDIARRLPSQVDVIVSGHTHAAYNCADVYGKRVTSASSFGRMWTDLELVLDRRTRDIAANTARNRVVTRTAAAPDITRLLGHWNAFAAPLRDRSIGRIAADIPEAYDDTGETAVGNLIADAQLAATKDPGTGGAVAAFMNPGGVRGDAGFLFAPDGVVTYGEAFDIQPFANTLVTLTYTGAQLLDALEQQWCGRATSPVILQPSDSVRYTFSRAAAAAARGKPCDTVANPITSLRINGAEVTPGGSYRITVNSFLAAGGDVFPGLTKGTEQLGGPVDLDALADYLKPSLTGAPVQPPALDRISSVP